MQVLGIDSKIKQMKEREKQREDKKSQTRKGANRSRSKEQPHSLSQRLVKEIGWLQDNVKGMRPKLKFHPWWNLTPVV